jgi:hypothetical protein
VKKLILAAALAAALATSASAQSVAAAPNYGSVNLVSGFQPDPYQVNLSSGGAVDAHTLGGTCTGMIATAPDYRLNYTSGSLPLAISVNSAADTTLVINLPNGQWMCDDDGGVNGMNPSIVLQKPQSGQYDIWVGTFGSSNLQPATLAISEQSTN